MVLAFRMVFLVLTMPSSENVNPDSIGERMMIISNVNGFASNLSQYTLLILLKLYKVS
jgi:hypothetical protein